MSVYPGGPPRATLFDELVKRYVLPFVGSLEVVPGDAPSNHRFTTHLASLTGVEQSLVYVLACRFAFSGRASQFLTRF